MQTVQSTMPTVYRWRRTEYDRLAETDILADRPVELIGGAIVEMSPKGPRHAALTSEAQQELAVVFPRPNFYIREEKPLALGEWDEPEPDLAVVVGAPRDYLDAHPTAEQTRLVVEVADTTASYDLGYKADLYAAAAISDLWVVLVEQHEVRVCRDPSPHPDSKTGSRYATRRTYRPGDLIAPLAAPDRLIAVAALLP